MAKNKKVNNLNGKKIKRICKLLPKKPKRASTGFGAFLKEFWVSLKDHNSRTRDSLKEAATQWHAMTEEQKVPYQLKVAEDRDRYTQEMNLWKRQKAFLTRPATMYALFVKDVWEREKDNGGTVSDVGTLAAAEWKVLPDDQKEVYNLRFQRSRRNYVLSLRDFQAGLEVDLDRKLDTEEEYVPLLPVPEANPNGQMDDGIFEDDWEDEDDELEDLDMA